MVAIRRISRFTGPKEAGHGMDRVGVGHDEVDAAARGNHFQRPRSTGDAENGFAASALEPTARLIRNYDSDKAWIIAFIAKHGAVG